MGTQPGRRVAATSGVVGVDVVRGGVVVGGGGGTEEVLAQGFGPHPIGHEGLEGKAALIPLARAANGHGPRAGLRDANRRLSVAWGEREAKGRQEERGTLHRLRLSRFTSIIPTRLT